MPPLRVQDHIGIVLVLEPAAITRIGLVVLDGVVELIRRISLDRIPDKTGTRRSRRWRGRGDDAVCKADFFFFVDGMVMVDVVVMWMKMISSLHVVHQVGGAAVGAVLGWDESVHFARSLVTVVMVVVVRVFAVACKNELCFNKNN